MNIKKLYYWHHRLLFLKAWYFLLPALLFGMLAVHSLRANYAKMVVLRQNVYTVDQQNGDVEAALTALRTQVYGHMNTNLSSGANAIKPPIQLKARYERLNEGETARVKAANDQVAAQGAAICGNQFPAGGFNAPRVACIQDYVGKNAVKSNAIQDSLYKFDFVSPRWSPDLAGFSIALSVIFSVLFVARFAIEYMVKLRLE